MKGTNKRISSTNSGGGRWVLVSGGILLAAAVLYAAGIQKWLSSTVTESENTASAIEFHPKEEWLKRAYAIRGLYPGLYVPGWEAANGAIGDAYLFAATRDSSLFRFHSVERDMRRMYNGTWVDDRAWICLAEMLWWDVTGRTNDIWVNDAKQRYDEARREGRLSKHEGYWSWYNWPPGAKVNDRIFTNSNMNHMVSVACWLFEATGQRNYLEDALLVWNGDGKTPGIEKTFYTGNGVWKGAGGLAAFGKQLPWEGTEYCSVAAMLHRVTNDAKYKDIAVRTVQRIMDPATGWIDPEDFYQIHMDGNGAFVNYLMDAFFLAPDELADIPGKIEKMLEHVWTNNHGRSRVILHRQSDHGIRNGWNPNGGEDGYGVDQIGTLHAQTQALRAFGVFAFYKNQK